jgi:hypothetical protein
MADNLMIPVEKGIARKYDVKGVRLFARKA